MERRRGDLYVIATSDDETRAALVEAKRLAAGADDHRVVLLVPHLVSFDAARGADQHTPGDITERFRALVFEIGLAVTVRLCFCRTRDDAFRWMLAEHSVVVVGGRRRSWWPSAVERMARRLIGDGHEVVFAAVRSKSRPARVRVEQPHASR